MKNIYKYICLGCITISLFFGCEVSRFDLQQNPNNLSPSSASPEYLLNEIQFLFQDIMGDMIRNTDDVMRYEAMTDTYGDVVDPTVLNLEWTRFYQALNLSKTIENLAESNSKFLYHKGISKLLLGYLTITFVDYVGSMPYSQALQPNEFPNAEADSGAELYKIVLGDIDQAILDINEATINVANDLFYDSDKDKWIAFANSLKLRLLIQTRLASADIGITDLTSEINTLLGENLIDDASEDFVYKFSDLFEPEGRHPYFIRGYESGFSQYISNYFMWMLKDSKIERDPRIRYYLYRQSNSDPFSGPPYLACQGDPANDYCYVGAHYWGLDHGEDRTGRGDNLLRTVYGIYPAGGSFDEDQFTTASLTSNLGGKGILPILTSSSLKFLTAEAALELGTNGDPLALLEEAIRASMNKVLNFGDISSSFESTSNDVNNYVAEVITNYLAATTDEERLDIIITEYYIATYGNSVEAYNAYRRTGYPSNIQTPINDNNPTFPRSFPYADDAVDVNTSLTQKLNTVKVFWDKNPDGFIK
jgi:hypothetical protein